MDTNKKKNILIASDHGGWEWKNILLDYLKQENIDVEDIGPFHYDPDDDYPDYANILLQKVSRGEASRGILLCRSGIGMSIMANRYHFIRAALALDEDYAKKSREHNNANILVTGGDKTSSGHLCSLVKTWLETPFSQEKRHLRRLKKIEDYTYDDMNPVRAIDPEIATFLDEEAQRQEEVLELIASENIVSPAVRTAQGSSLTNKYAEGYPEKRYYDGCECVDKVEKIAIERAKTLFGAEGVNVQPHSGSQANMAVYFALLNPGDTILAMSLAHGGHLTHGAKVNFSGRLFTIIGYGVDKETEKIDYDDVKKLALEHRPKMILAGASAYSRYIDFSQLRQIADSIGAYLVVDMAHIAGLVAAGVHPSPIPMADVVTTTTHKTLRGPRGGLIFCKEAYQKKINSQIFPGIQGGPLMHVIAAKAVCLKEAMTKEFVSYQKQVVKNAQCLANQLAEKGFRIVSGGTDNHLLLVDLRPLGTTGNKAAHALDRAGITVNKNMIPFDPEKPFVTSGLRIGTPAVTTRGMQETEMILIGEWIYRIVRNPENEQIQRSIRDEVIALTKKFPLYQN